MSISWQAEVWATMKDHAITRGELARVLGLTPEYVSAVLNKKRCPAKAEQRFRAALAGLILEKNQDGKE